MTLIATPAQVLECVNEKTSMLLRFGCSFTEAMGAILRLYRAGLVDRPGRLTDAGRAALTAGGDGGVGQ